MSLKPNFRNSTPPFNVRKKHTSRNRRYKPFESVATNGARSTYAPNMSHKNKSMVRNLKSQ